jgi:hypothetical protein
MINAMIEKIPRGLMSEKTERYFGALIERAENKLDLILEHLDFSDKRTGALEPRMDRAEVRLDGVELRLMDKE